MRELRTHIWRCSDEMIAAESDPEVLDRQGGSDEEESRNQLEMGRRSGMPEQPSPQNRPTATNTIPEDTKADNTTAVPLRMIQSLKKVRFTLLP